MANTYTAGALVTVATYEGDIADPVGGFRDSTGALADPSIVTLTYRTSQTGPKITVVYPAAPIIRDGTGLYRAGLDTTGSPDAVWTYEWTGYGGVQAPAANSFIVRAPFS